jgi:hypothetical protein
MKKMLGMAAIAMCMAGTTYAACVLGSAFCADDTGVFVGGLLQDGNGAALPTASSTTIVGIVPRAIGQEIYCNTCVNNSSTNKIELCVSTATAVNSYVFVSSTTKVCK